LAGSIASIAGKPLALSHFEQREFLLNGLSKVHDSQAWIPWRSSDAEIRACHETTIGTVERFGKPTLQLPHSTAGHPGRRAVGAYHVPANLTLLWSHVVSHQSPQLAGQRIADAAE
jgi:hypothetical protein